MYQAQWAIDYKPNMLFIKPSALSIKPSTLSTQAGVLSTQASELSTNPSVNGVLNLISSSVSTRNTKQCYWRDCGDANPATELRF